MESYREEAKKGKELNKDQKEALEKYSDVLGQIECLKELSEQFKKLQNDVCFLFCCFISLEMKFILVCKSPEKSFKATCQRET